MNKCILEWQPVEMDIFSIDNMALQRSNIKRFIKDIEERNYSPPEFLQSLALKLINYN